MQKRCYDFWQNIVSGIVISLKATALLHRH